jgi:hypothetical protein
MNNKVLLAALAGAVATFLTGWLLYGILLKGFFEAGTLETARSVMREQPELLAIFFGGLAWSLLLALIFSRWASISTLRSGAIAGAWIGFLIALGADLFSYASMNIAHLNTTLIDPLINAVQSAIAGGIIGWVLGYGAKK